MKLNEQERLLHDRATKVRRMTDQQLCAYLEAEYQRGVEDGQHTGVGEAPLAIDAVLSFIKYLEGRLGSKNGIGRGTLLQLRRELDNASQSGVFEAIG